MASFSSYTFTTVDDLLEIHMLGILSVNSSRKMVLNLSWAIDDLENLMKTMMDT